MWTYKCSSRHALKHDIQHADVCCAYIFTHSMLICSCWSINQFALLDYSVLWHNSQHHYKASIQPKWHCTSKPHIVKPIRVYHFNRLNQYYAGSHAIHCLVRWVCCYFILIEWSVAIGSFTGSAVFVRVWVYGTAAYEQSLWPMKHHTATIAQCLFV